MVFCESWLNDTISDDVIYIPGYNCLRSDRILRRGGGVCIYTKDYFPARCLIHLPPPPTSIESIWIFLPSLQIILLALYVPPGLTATQHNEINDYVVICADEAFNKVPDSNLIILGDVNNLPTVDLENSLSLHQVVKTPTRGSSILDKIFIDEGILHSYCSPITSPNFGRADHLAVILHPVSRQSNPPKIVQVFDFRASNIDNFLKSLKAQRWQDLYYLDDTIDKKCDLFYNMISNALEAIPSTFVELSANEKPWITPTLKLLINMRFEAYRLGDFHKYKHLKLKVRNEIDKAKKNWIKSLKESPHGIWKAIKKPNRGFRIASIANCDSTSAAQLPDLINKAFSASFSAATLENFVISKSTLNDSQWDIEINTDLTKKLIGKLKSGKASGIDGLTTRLLKAGMEEIAAPLTHLFVESVSTGAVPKHWKVASVVPIPKKQNPTINDFRPISLLSLPSKILESYVLSSVKESLISLYGPNQYGFRPKSSTLLAHLTMQDFITDQMDKIENKGVLLITFDIKKAFDSLSHSSLLQTLSEGGLPFTFIKWIQSFLKDRKQYVVVNGATSSTTVDVSSGVPQGSVLAPYLFASHMRSLLPALSTTKLVKFADDVTLLCPYQRNTSLDEVYCLEMKNMLNWCYDHGLTLNDNKTKLMLFKKQSIDHPPTTALPPIVNHLKMLGVTFQDNLSWNEHIKELTKAAAKRIHILKMLRKIPDISKQDLITIYNTIIVSVLEFNSPLLIGMTKTNSDSLEKIRKRCHRIICGSGCNCNSFPSLSDRREMQAMKVFQQMQSPNNLCHSLLPHIHTRSKHFFIPFLRTERRCKSFVPAMCLRWNSSL